MLNTNLDLFSLLLYYQTLKKYIGKNKIYRKYFHYSRYHHLIFIIIIIIVFIHHYGDGEGTSYNNLIDKDIITLT